MLKIYSVTLQKIAGDTDSEFTVQIAARYWQDAMDMAQADYEESMAVYVTELRQYLRSD